MEVDGREIDLGVSLEPGQAVRWTGEGAAVLHDATWQQIGRVEMAEDRLRAPTGAFTAKVTCRFAGADSPALKVELRTASDAVRLVTRR